MSSQFPVKQKGKATPKGCLPFISCPALQWLFSGIQTLACPFFVPLQIVHDGSWLHPSRLPLGAGWTGDCCAAGERLSASDTQIREFCNLGYATACPHLPAGRDWDAVRFSVANTNINARQFTLWYTCELAHAPIEHGKLTFNLASGECLTPHADSRVHRLATSYVESYRARNRKSLAASDL
jgi:hypothetical protein